MKNYSNLGIADATECKRLDVAFPGDLQGYQQFREEASKRKAAEKQQTQGDLHAEITALSARIQEQDKQIAGLQGENRVLAENNRGITAKLEQAMAQTGAGKKQPEAHRNEPERALTRWQHFKAFIFGSGK